MRAGFVFAAVVAAVMVAAADGAGSHAVAQAPQPPQNLTIRVGDIDVAYRV
jgi:hypothetical protein